MNLINMIAILSRQPDSAASNSSISYILGGIIALLIFAYLIYTLLRPDKF